MDDHGRTPEATPVAATSRPRARFVRRYALWAGIVAAVAIGIAATAAVWARHPEAVTPHPSRPEPRRAGEPGAIEMPRGQQRAIGLKVAKAVARMTSDEVKAPGRIAADQEHFAFITPRAPGVVRSVAVNIGQEVRKGDVLATIDSPEVGRARLELRTQLQLLEVAKAQAKWEADVYANTLQLIEGLRKGEEPDAIQGRLQGKPVGAGARPADDGLRAVPPGLLGDGAEQGTRAGSDGLAEAVPAGPRELRGGLGELPGAAGQHGTRGAAGESPGAAGGPPGRDRRGRGARAAEDPGGGRRRDRRCAGLVARLRVGSTPEHLCARGPLRRDGPRPRVDRTGGFGRRGRAPLHDRGFVDGLAGGERLRGGLRRAGSRPGGGSLLRVAGVPRAQLRRPRDLPG
jgi:biotin carboxyl carrier protein